MGRKERVAAPNLEATATATAMATAMEMATATAMENNPSGQRAMSLHAMMRAITISLQNSV